MSVEEAISKAEAILPGVAAPEREEDPRWQAIIAIGDFIAGEPHAVWDFAARWGQSQDADLRMAVATSLLEHLLEHHFELVFPRVEELAIRSSSFADTFCSCWSFGQSDLPQNAERLKRLRSRLCGTAA